jgi:hypothetical protein
MRLRPLSSRARVTAPGVVVHSPHSGAPHAAQDPPSDPSEAVARARSRHGLSVRPGPAPERGRTVRSRLWAVAVPAGDGSQVRQRGMSGLVVRGPQMSGRQPQLAGVTSPDGSHRLGCVRLESIMARRRSEAVTAEHDLADALARAEIVLPSLGVEQVPVIGSGVFLVELGRARPDVIAQLAAVVRLGAEAQRAQRGVGAP